MMILKMMRMRKARMKKQEEQNAAEEGNAGQIQAGISGNAEEEAKDGIEFVGVGSGPSNKRQRTD